jgi:hypothetical protein
MAEIVFSWLVSETKCIIFKKNNDNPYEIHNNYIKLSIVFHPMLSTLDFLLSTLDFLLSTLDFYSRPILLALDF